MTQQVHQLARCDCSIAALAMYCGVGYYSIWSRLTQRERFMISYGQGLFYKQVARIALDLVGHHMWYFDTFDQPLDGYSALLTIASPSLSEDVGREVNHCVYWDGEKTWDTRPSGLDSGSFPANVVGYEIAGEHFSDPPDGWKSYYEEACDMALGTGLGPSYAQGLLPWRLPSTPTPQPDNGRDE